MLCLKCNKSFKSNQGLSNHNSRNPNCMNKCSICLKTYVNQQSLKRHSSINCKQKYECKECFNTFSTRHNLHIHEIKCLQLNKKDMNHDISKIIENLPDKKGINVNIKIVNVNNVNSNNKIKITNNKNTFFEKEPVNFRFGYVKEENIDYKELSLIDGYNENMADMYMYEENKFKEEQPKDMIYKYEKENLKVQGMQLLFTQLQKNPKNRNTRIKKTKSGKCYIYDKEWIEEKVQTIITKICCNLCDLLYDKETSVNHFIRLVIADQPRRLSELRKHIEEEIVRINEIERIEVPEIE